MRTVKSSAAKAIVGFLHLACKLKCLLFYKYCAVTRGSFNVLLDGYIKSKTWPRFPQAIVPVGQDGRLAKCGSIHARHVPEKYSLPS
jgi:hypothetical protein